MSNGYPILHYFFPSEENNVVSISPSQLGRIHRPNQACPLNIQDYCLEVTLSIYQLPSHQWRCSVAAAHHFVLALIYNDTCYLYALSFH